MSIQISDSSTNSPETQARQRWMGVLAKAPVAALEEAWSDLESVPEFKFLRRPECGLVMVRGRTGGSGRPFNLGEMTMTRCVVRLADSTGATGFSHVAGRDRRHAELAALFDAMLQEQQWHDRLQDGLIAPLERQAREARATKAAAVAATKVEFFTMVRGE